MRLYEYKDYETYKAAQVKANKKKLCTQWVKKEEILIAAEVLLQKRPGIEFGLCHGTRQGNEQKWFARYTGAKVLGTEISDTATKFPDTIEWDFHDIKPEWEGAVDFIYSNALDHSYDPKMCLTQWMKCLKPGGYTILHHSRGHHTSCARDPFGASRAEYKEMIEDLGFVLEDVTDGGEGEGNTKCFMWVQNS